MNTETRTLITRKTARVGQTIVITHRDGNEHRGTMTGWGPQLLCIVPTDGGRFGWKRETYRSFDYDKVERIDAAPAPTEDAPVETDPDAAFPQELEPQDASVAMLSDTIREIVNFNYNADLRGGRFQGVNLQAADLSTANLAGANLTDADLADADLSDANLAGANLTSANLQEADLRRANLRGVDFSYADLRGSDRAFAITGTKAILTGTRL